MTRDMKEFYVFERKFISDKVESILLYRRKGITNSNEAGVGLVFCSERKFELTEEGLHSECVERVLTSEYIANLEKTVREMINVDLKERNKDPKKITSYVDSINLRSYDTINFFD